MEFSTVIVSVLFGGLMGWGFARNSPDLTPPVVAMALGFLTGIVVWIVDPDAVLASRTLVIGCAAGLISLATMRFRLPTS